MAQGATLGWASRQGEPTGATAPDGDRCETRGIGEAPGARLPPATAARKVEDGDEQDEREQEPRGSAELSDVRVEDGGYFHRV